MAPVAFGGFGAAAPELKRLCLLVQERCSITRAPFTQSAVRKAELRFNLRPRLSVYVRAPITPTGESRKWGRRWEFNTAEKPVRKHYADTAEEVADWICKMYDPTLSEMSEIDRVTNLMPPAVVTHPLNQILYGPPGTGKTWHTVTRAVAIVEGRGVGDVAQEERATVRRRFEEYREAGRMEMVTFTQNTTYEDFVEGIRPVLAKGMGGDAAEPGETEAVGDVRYELSRGVFRRIAERATRAGDARYVLVIDEINRGNVARIFGELITLIEDSKRIGREDEVRVTLPGSKVEFGVPANLYVVGTMNTADRSIALLDTALRRRFVFEEMMPDPNHPGVCADAEGVDCRALLRAMNRRIAVLLDREHQIGHTYFLALDSLAGLASTFRTRIVPLLQEYFYDDWEKIRAVLNGNGFVQVAEPPDELVRQDLADAGRSVYELLPPDDGRWTTATAYRAIYEAGASTEGGSATPGT